MGNRIQGSGGRTLSAPWRTLRGRLALASLAGLVVASLVFTLVGSQLISGQSTRVARDELDRQTVVLAELISEDAERAAREGRVFRFLPRDGVETLVGEDTRLFFTGLALSPGADEPNAEIPSIIVDRLSYDVLDRDGVQRLDFTEPGAAQEIEASAAPVTVGNETAGAVLLARPVSEFGNSTGAVASRTLIAALVGLGVALLLLVYLTGRVTRPLRDMQEATRQVAAGDLNTRLQPAGTVELDEVSTAFNQMVEQLANRERMSRDFLMKITHDLRTPLTAIRGHATALADGVVPEDDVPRSLGAIEGEAARLETMVTDLLDLARLEANRFRVELDETDPVEVLDHAFHAHEAEAASQGVDYELQVAEMPIIVTDPIRIRQIVGNLLENALRWTPPGGSVVLRAAVSDHGAFDITVSDTGPGVPDHMRETIFAPFESAETPDGRVGSGLGLAISRQLARALGGDLTVGDGEEGGAVFRLHLPRESVATGQTVAG